MDYMNPLSEVSWAEGTLGPEMYPFPPPQRQPEGGCLAHGLGRAVWLRHVINEVNSVGYSEAIHMPVDTGAFFRELDVPHEDRPLLNNYFKYCINVGVPGVVNHAPDFRPPSRRVAIKYARSIHLIGPQIDSPPRTRYKINSFKMFDMKDPVEKQLMKYQLLQNGPIAGCFFLCHDYPSHSDDLYEARGAFHLNADTNNPLRHMVVIVGCGKSNRGRDYLIYQDNYGPNFRGDGYGRIYLSALEAAYVPLI